MNDYFFPSLKNVDKYFVGFDKTFNELSKFHDEIAKNIPNYPPYNIRKVEDNKYVVEIAVAGFSKSEIEIEIEDSVLKITGNSVENETGNYLFQGLAKRPFTRTFKLDDTIEVQNAEMINGLLRVALERIIPEHKKPKKIEINSSEKEDTRQLLNEGE